MSESKIIQNAIQCPDGTVIVSTHRHDFQEHGGYSVDGGRDYLRRCYPLGAEDLIIELSLTEGSSYELKVERLVWGTYGKDGKDELKYVRLSDCSDGHLKAILKLDIIKREDMNIYRSVIETILKSRGIILNDPIENKIKKSLKL